MCSVLKNKVHNLGKADALATPVRSVRVRTEKEGNMIVLLRGIQVENHLFCIYRAKERVSECVSHIADSSPERTGRNTSLHEQ